MASRGFSLRIPHPVNFACHACFVNPDDAVGPGGAIRSCGSEAAGVHEKRGAVTAADGSVRMAVDDTVNGSKSMR